MVILSCNTPKAWSSAGSQGESLPACMGVIRVQIKILKEEDLWISHKTRTGITLIIRMYRIRTNHSYY